MPAIKCNKCGAVIPADAAFCPGCGAPKAAQTVSQPTQPAQTQPVAPAPVQPAAPRQPMGSNFKGLADTFFSKLFIMIGLCIGILLALISRIMIVYNTTNLGVYQISLVLNLLAFSGISLVMIGGGLLNTKLQKYARAGMIASGGLVLVLSLSLTNI